MDAQSFDNLLNAFAAQVPFRPFTVVMNTGDQFEIDFPRALVNRAGVAVYLSPGGIPVFFDHNSVNQFVGDLKPQVSNTEP